MLQIKNGKAVMCYGDLLSIYRYVGNNKLQAYTNPSVAAAWDRDWANPIYIDCCSLTFDGYFLEIPAGQTVTFKDRNIGKLYRYNYFFFFMKILTMQHYLIQFYGVVPCR